MKFHDWLRRRNIIAEIQFMLTLEISFEAADPGLSDEEFLIRRTNGLERIMRFLVHLRCKMRSDYMQGIRMLRCRTFCLYGNSNECARHDMQRSMHVDKR